MAAAAGVVQSVVSEVEAGRLGGRSFATIRRLFAAVDAGFEGDVRWRGAALDRLLDRRHAQLVGATVDRLTRLGWETVIEATYAVFGERGSIDVLGGRPVERVVLVEEVKSEVASVEATLRKLDEKVRLVREVVAPERFGWQPVAVGRLLVVPDSTTSRRQVARIDGILGIALPDRGAVVRRWLRHPDGDLAGILFQPVLASGDGVSNRGGIHRVRVPRVSVPAS